MNDIIKEASGAGTIDFNDYEDVINRSTHNAYSSDVMFGKYDGGSENNYIYQAKDKGFAYFDLGDDWETVKKAQGLTDDDMFELYNQPFLDDAMNYNKTIHFSHNPVIDKGTLHDELLYLLENGYEYDPITMIAKPKGY